ncbi:MAG: BNR-4 repeat-containing protein [Opitutaceae bacterium]|nr:BNR-4 repeat-containing protein [Opitutaceae bacterium]
MSQSPVSGARSVGVCPAFTPPVVDGFHGVWYGYTDGTYYAGGLGTFPQQIHPMACHAAKAGERGRTFFVWGGAKAGLPGNLLTTISYFDHATGLVARPRVLNDRQTNDGHDNPSMMLDGAGHIYVFSNAHGTLRDAFIYRSTRPYEIDEFQTVLALDKSANFSYAQPWYIDGRGFLLLHSFYGFRDPIRRLYFNTSRDGLNWDHGWNLEGPKARPAFALIPGGNYQVSKAQGRTVGTMFDYNVDRVGRTNLYYVQTSDFGQSWQTAEGEPVTLPFTTVKNPALVHDYEAEHLYVFMKEMDFDAKGQPVLMYLTTPTEANDTTTPRQWRTAHFNRAARQWVIRDAFVSDNNYDHGTFSIEPDGLWRVIAPTAPGPQPGRTGGDMEMWTSRDEGVTWQRQARLTHGGAFNHSYARQPVQAHDDFYAFWADGDVNGESESALYFTDRQGTAVWRLPQAMSGDFAKPEPAFKPIKEVEIA